MEIAPHLLPPYFVNYFEGLTSAQFDPERRLFATMDGVFVIGGKPEVSVVE